MFNLMLYGVLAFSFLILMMLYIKIANHFNIIDKPNERSSHNNVTVRGGGVLFLIGALLYFIYSGFSYPFFFFGLAGVSLISFADDVFTLPNRYRLPFQFLAIFCILYQLDFLSQYSWLIFSLSLIVGVGIINVYNFMDGINGLTGIYSLSVISALWIVNNHHLYFIDNDFLYFISASLLVFNFFNFRKKAVCFAGDVGSISIAVIILFLIAKLSIGEREPVYFLFLSVYGIDGTVTILERLYLKENIFKAHRRHLFQILVNEKKMSHLTIASLYATVQFLVSIFIIYSIEQDLIYRNILSVMLVTGLLFVYCFIKFAVIKSKK
jgi:UDP-GlcNAc:undecaprenyl-phosphate GlcNAc-1-phosphate transferase